MLIAAARRGGWFTVLYFVDVSEATSHRRNAARGRTVPADVVAEKHRLVGSAWLALRALPDAAIRIDNDQDDPALADLDRGVADLDAADEYAALCADADADAAAEFSRLAGSAGVATVATVAGATIAGATVMAGGGMLIGIAAIVIAAAAIGGAFAGPGRVAHVRGSWRSGSVKISRNHRMLIAAADCLATPEAAAADAVL